MGSKLFPKRVPIIKRLFDLILAIPGFILISPVFLILSILVYVKEGRPVFFKQQRPGLRGEVFKLYKFRTMREPSNDDKLQSDAERLTKFGRFLRETSLDELPELLNVIKGDMSLVGPRPLLLVYLDRYNAEQARRHDVLPGMTGWAQINGRNAISWDEKFKLDVWYVDHWSLWLDVKILWTTIWKVVTREGINQPGEATMQEFLGNKQ